MSNLKEHLDYADVYIWTIDLATAEEYPFFQGSRRNRLAQQLEALKNHISFFTHSHLIVLLTKMDKLRKKLIEQPHTRVALTQIFPGIKDYADFGQIEDSIKNAFLDSIGAQTRKTSVLFSSLTEGELAGPQVIEALFEDEPGFDPCQGWD